MKRTISIILVIMALFSLTGCTETPRYLRVWIFQDDTSNLEEAETSGAPLVGIPLDDYSKEKIQQLLLNLKEAYGIEKQLPPSYLVSSEELERWAYGEEHPNITVAGLFDQKKGRLFVSDVEDNATILHELIHYLKDDGSGNYRLGYQLDDFRQGAAFEEGATNFLASEIAPVVSYQFETFVAETFATAYGKEAFQKDFFSSDMFEKFRDDFNQSLENVYEEAILEGLVLTPFDILVGDLETYRFCCTIVGTEYDQVTQFGVSASALDAARVGDSIVEMLLFYGEAKGVKAEQQELLKEFLEKEEMSWWTALSNLEKLAKG